MLNKLKAGMNCGDYWNKFIAEELTKPYMDNLSSFLATEYAKNKVIYPEKENIFRAFELCPYEKTKVLILGQDPYHGIGQAHGLCFSVRPSVQVPPSLLNIYKELEEDLQIKPAEHGHLVNWSLQGVMLLNSVLTVEQSKAGSHQGKGWEEFTDAVVAALNEKSEPMVFVLWGAYAQKKGAVIDKKKHLVLKSTHPSPLSAYRGFLGCKHFSKINSFLHKNKQSTIEWQLPELV